VHFKCWSKSYLLNLDRALTLIPVSPDIYDYKTEYCGLLIDAGFCDKYTIDVDDNDQSSELQEEILQAPWNTTRAYLGALKGKCSMQVFGIGGK
jgi:hypothetical protein